MLNSLHPRLVIATKQYGFLLFALAMALPWFGYQLGLKCGHPDLFTWFTLFVVFAAIPLVDYLVGKDPVNPEEAEVLALSDIRYYRLLTLLVPPGFLVELAWAADIFQQSSFSLAGQIGWIMSVGKGLLQEGRAPVDGEAVVAGLIA